VTTHREVVRVAMFPRVRGMRPAQEAPATSIDAMPPPSVPHACHPVAPHVGGPPRLARAEAVGRDQPR
jgi:hypothetical protein